MKDIMDAIDVKDWEHVKQILKEDPAQIHTLTDEGLSIHHLVSGMRVVDILKYIIENALSRIEKKDPCGRNCLHFAAMNNNFESIKYLADQVGFSLLEADYSGMTPYEIMIRSGVDEIIDYAIKKTGFEPESTYKNPIRTGMFPDPSIVRVEDDYYMVNSTFVFFPCIPISHSKDMINWKIIGYAITNPKWANIDHLEGGRGYWAPDISYYEGKFFITATLRHNDGGTVIRQQVIVFAEKPEGPYSEPTVIDVDGIDPSLFTDDDGRRYMLLNRGARLIEIEPDGSRQLSEPYLIYYGDLKTATEGPHLLKKDGWYYLFLAEGGTGRGHQISVARSQSLKGPYEPCPYNPILTQKDPNAQLQCCGHGKPVMTQAGEWYMVYLTYRFINGSYGMLGRETALDPITWTSDGWPIVNGLKGPSLIQKRPILKNIQTVSMETPIHGESVLIGNEIVTADHWKDTFSNKSLDLSYMFPRVPETDAVRIEDSKLWIKGSKAELSSIDARNMVLRRQMHFSFTATVSMLVPDLDEMQNGGMLAYYDENTFIKFGVIQKNGTTLLQIFEKIGSNETITYESELQSIERIDLKTMVNGLKRSFFYRIQEEWIHVDTLDNVYYLCSEGITYGKRFTGATIGMYAVAGVEKALKIPFTRFEYQGLDNGPDPNAVESNK